jgi:hypothetical protein
VLKITKTAVHQSSRPGRNSVAEVFLLDHGNPETTLSRIAQNTETVDTRSDYDQIKITAWLRHICPSRCSGLGWPDDLK